MGTENEGLVQNLTKEIQREEGNWDRPAHTGMGVAVIIDRHSIISYLQNFLYVAPIPLKHGQVGNLWGVGGQAKAADAIIEHIERRIAILKRKRANK